MVVNYKNNRILKEIYRVRKITVSLLDWTTHKVCKMVPCEFGVIKEKEGILFLEAHVFENEDFALFNYENLGCYASAKMYTFNNIKIEASYMAYVGMSTDECTITFQCYDYITINEEDSFYSYQKSLGEEHNQSQLLRIDFWGLDLLINKHLKTQLMVADAPFDMQLAYDKGKSLYYATFSYNEKVAHNTLSLDLFDLFRDSLVGYLSLINGARVQIVKEYYNGYLRLYSFNKIENLSRSYYACGNTKVFCPSPILFEFDNYVRWNNALQLNKFVHHLCTAQQIIDYEDRSFILILVFEGLSKQYFELRKSKIAPRIISKESFEQIKSAFVENLNSHPEIAPESNQKIMDGFCRLNDVNFATYKFRLILDDLGIEQNKEIKKLIKSVRSTLVHEAKLNEYSDYQLLSELIRELILRLINSNVERHSHFTSNIIVGDTPKKSYSEYKKEKDISIDNDEIISKFDERIKLRITVSENMHTT